MDIYLDISELVANPLRSGIQRLANQALVDSMEAPSYVFAVPDRPSPVLIAEALATAIEQRRASRLAEEERRAYCDAHSFRAYAAQLCAALSLDLPRSAAA